jgi:phosphoglucosamine mutase
MPVGDRYVLEHMREHGYNVGGEPSGHIILSDYTTTGDGFIAALQVLAVVKKQDKPVSEVCHRFVRCRRCSRTCAIAAASRWKI